MVAGVDFAQFSRSTAIVEWALFWAARCWAALSDRVRRGLEDIARSSNRGANVSGTTDVGQRPSLADYILVGAVIVRPAKVSRCHDGFRRCRNHCNRTRRPRFDPTPPDALERITKLQE